MVENPNLRDFESSTAPNCPEIQIQIQMINLEWRQFILLFTRALFVLISSYNAGQGAYIDDPEPEVTWTPPKFKVDFEHYKPSAKYTGLLYAGAVEFNWIVDIRNEDGSQDEWAVGNLVSYYHVLTTCRGIMELNKHGNPGVKKYDSKNAWEVEEYPQNEITAIRVYYCEYYLWEGGVVMPDDHDTATSGSRSIRQIIRHPQCYFPGLAYDAAIIVMAKGIPPLGPRLGYMPTAFDYIRETTKVDIKLDPKQRIDHNSPVCYVAAFGRNYLNNEELYVLDYKIKIRVYISEWNECGKVWKYICRDGNHDCPSSTNSIRDNGGAYRYCFRPRTQVGAVCDRDRGAPVVCNGVVIALVIRGAGSSYCNNLYKIPFVAERLERYLTFFDKTLAYKVRPVPEKSAPGRPAAPASYSGASAYNVMELLSLLCFANLANAIK